MTSAIAAMVSHPDAELIRLGVEFGRLHAAWLRLRGNLSP